MSTLDKFNSIQQTPDGGYIAAGSAGSSNIYLVKTDANGEKIWGKEFGRKESSLNGKSVYICEDGGYIITGYSLNLSTYRTDIYLAKTFPDGDTAWTKTIGGAKSDYGFCVRQTPDKNYIVAGYTSSFGAGGDDIYLIKLKNEGPLEVIKQQQQKQTEEIQQPQQNQTREQRIEQRKNR